jgi:hypothetical protein
MTMPWGPDLRNYFVARHSAYNHSVQEADAGRLRVQGQPGLGSETLS